MTVSRRWEVARRATDHCTVFDLHAFRCTTEERLHNHMASENVSPNRAHVGIRLAWATPADIDGCHQVDRSFDLGFETRGDVFRRALERQQLLVAQETNGRVIGYLRWGYFWDDELPYVQMIRILEAYRRQGIGSRLVRHLEDHIKEQGAHFLLSSTDETNHWSMSFHHRLGFEMCGSLAIPGDPCEILLLKRL